LLDSNKYWIIGSDDDETPINVACIMQTRPAVSKGGDGSDELNAAEDCRALLNLWGKTVDDNGDYFLGVGDDISEEECEFDKLGATIVSRTMGGVVTHSMDVQATFMRTLRNRESVWLVHAPMLTDAILFPALLVFSL
jgi:hypothetical protein